jgi:hypothetical protein
MLGYNRGDCTDSILRLCNASRVLIASLIPNSTIHLPLTTGEEPHVEVVPLMLRTGTRRSWSRGSSHLNLITHTQSWRCCYGGWWWCYRWQPKMLPSAFADATNDGRRCYQLVALLQRVCRRCYQLHVTNDMGHVAIDCGRCCSKHMRVILLMPYDVSWCVVNDQPVGTPRGRCDEYSS